MKKVFLVFLCVLAVGVPLFASGGAQASASKVIACFLPHKNNEWANDLAAALKKEVEAAGYEYGEYVADNDVQRQISQVEQAIQRKVAGLILDAIDPEALGPVVTSAKQAGIPLVLCHEGLNDPKDAVSSVIPDFKKGGQDKMAEAIKDMPNGGNIAFMYGPQGHPAQQLISSGYPLALKGVEDKYPVVFTAYGDWSDVSALDPVSSWLSSGKQIDAIISDNGGMAIGVLQAIEAAGKTGQIKVYGLDGVRREFEAIKEGRMSATIYTDVPAEAKNSVEQVVNAINKRPVQKEILLPMIVVNKSNVDQYLK
ncbi:MAG: sugar ABC transporter substrate-binding protein [Treponema sp.]|jgi:ABC-type sugar transport system substrate-binding protein|nr:sugar ABC transporter substrate-binding protein [Treponema sp.]